MSVEKRSIFYLSHNKFSLLIYSNAQKEKRVHVKIINTLEFARKLSLRRIFISFHKPKDLFQLPFCFLCRITQRINFNMYAQELILIIMTCVIIVVRRGQTACLPGPRTVLRYNLASQNHSG